MVDKENSGEAERVLRIISTMYPCCRCLSRPELLDFTLCGKTILVVNEQFGLFWPIHSGGEHIAYICVCTYTHVVTISIYIYIGIR